MSEPVLRANCPPKFAFAVPLKARSAASDWESVQHNLRRTVTSALLAAEGLPASIYIACHDRPDLQEDLEGKVRILSVPFPAPRDARDGGCDKAKKRRFIGAWLRGQGADEVYIMFLDADDLVHRDTVSHVLSGQGHSYLAENGYVMDLERGLLLRRARFHHICGSSFICRFARDELPVSCDDIQSPFSLFGSRPQQRGHEEYPQIAAELGKPSSILPFAAVVYTVNHGESLWAAKAKATRELRRPGEIIRPAAARRVLGNAFGASELAARIAGPWGVIRALTGVPVAVARARLRRWLARPQ